MRSDNKLRARAHWYDVSKWSRQPRLPRPEEPQLEGTPALEKLLASPVPPGAKFLMTRREFIRLGGDPGKVADYEDDDIACFTI